MRELWAAARRRIDVDLIMPMTVLACFGVEVGEGLMNDLNPLRKLEQPPPPEKTPEAKESESKAGWALIRKFFKQKRR